MGFPPVIAILGTDEERVVNSAFIVLTFGGAPIVCSWGEELPEGVGGLLLSCDETADLEQTITAIKGATDMGLPVLGIGWGMSAVNLAMGGGCSKYSANSPRTDTEKTVKKSLFLSPGGKISHTVGGSGWVAVHVESCSIPLDNVADGLLVSCYSEDRLAYGVEREGNNWVMGIGWNPSEPGRLPKGFDNFIPALIDRASKNSQD